MKRKILAFFACLVLFAAAFPVTASADMGPKPSVVIDFKGLSGQTYYVTLLSSVDSTGPFTALSRLKQDNSTVDAKEWYSGNEEDYPIYLKFVGYQDPDGYYFLQYFQNCSETQQFSWTYYPPQNFKILIYFADSGGFAVSAAYERYAFDSYFSVDLTGTDVIASAARGETPTFNAVKSYDYSVETVSLIARIILTIAVELLVALLFAFRKKKQLLFILAVNVVTQIALNVSLNLINFSYGLLAFIALYVLLELLVFIVEAILYAAFLKKFSDMLIPRWKPILYALAANAASFGVGLLLARIIPGLF